MNMTIPRTISILSTASDIGDPGGEVYLALKHDKKRAKVIPMCAVPLRPRVLCIMLFPEYKQQ